jgi:uncharacterized protein YbjT (DUF2867 family)
LGQQVVERLQKTGYTVRIMSRKGKPDAVSLEWAQVDILAGQGLEQAVAGVDVIVNCMSNPQKNTHAVDVQGTRLLLEKARAAQVAHFLHVSIVGIERIPFSYYKEKVAAESVVKAGGVPWSILRATQFHSLIDLFLSMFPARLGVMPLPGDFKFQTIHVGEVADHLMGHLETPSGLLPDIGGPEVLTAGEMARAWLVARGLKRLILPLPLPGKVADGFRHGYNTCPDRRIGKITWAEWLSQKYAVQLSKSQQRSATVS